MNNPTFQFTDAAKLYVSNLNVIENIQNLKTEEARQLLIANESIINEMRLEAYRNLAEFGDRLIEALSKYSWGNRRFRYMTTPPRGKYSGGKIVYLWIEASVGKEIRRKVWEVGMVHIVLPSPNQVPRDNDPAWRDFWKVFDIISENKMRVWLGSETKNKEKVLNLAKDSTLGEVDEVDPFSCSMRISFDSKDPIQSASMRLATLIQAVNLAETE